MDLLEVVTFCDKALPDENALLISCRENNIPLHVLQPNFDWSCNTLKLRLLWDFVSSGELSDDCIILVSDAFDVLINEKKEKILKKYFDLGAEIIFSAEANYYFRNPDLNYFYWKHYPRNSILYHFLNSGNYMGTVENIRKLLATVFEKYNVDINDTEQLRTIRSDQYLLSRFYVDYYYSPQEFPFTIKLDHRQSLFACTAGRMFATDEIPTHWMEAFYYFRYQRFLFKYSGLAHHQTRCADIRFIDGVLVNKQTGENPAVLHIAGSGKTFSLALNQLRYGHKIKSNKVSSTAASIVNKTGRVAAGITRRLIEYINGGEYSSQSVFRYDAQPNPEYVEAGEQIVTRLVKRNPVAFSHFNEEDIEAITNYPGKKNTNISTVRHQHNNDPLLVDALYQSLNFTSAHYFRGIPCGRYHTDLRNTIAEITGNENTVIPAMTLHQNQALMPRLLLALEARELWFIANPLQDLSFFENKGLTVNPDRVFRLPFQKFHKEIERFKRMQFPDKAVVIVTCGMLGKVLMPIWIENNPNTSFLDLGSSLDDHIQNTYRFRLFPTELPMTKNLYKSKHFLFGPKTMCPQCYPIED